MAGAQNYMRDRAAKFALLIGIGIAVQLAYSLVVLPRADAWTEAQRALVQSTPGYRPERSFFVII